MDDIMNQTVIAEQPQGWEALPEGDYGIVELFGHTTLVGRVTEIERFGTKMMAIEILFNGALLAPIYHGGAAIYRFSPCSAQVAWNRHHKETWSLPPAIRAVLPPELLPPPSMHPSPETVGNRPEEGDDDPYQPDDDEPF
jgi:hypothetical protein